MKETILKWLLVVVINGEQQQKEYKTQQLCEDDGMEFFMKAQQAEQDKNLQIYCIQVTKKAGTNI